MKRAALFAHFDRQDEIKPYILYFLKHLQALCDDIIFTSTSRLPATETDKLRSFASTIELRDNTGFDFGMWRYALKLMDISRFDEVVLANSSVFGPIFPLLPIFERMGRDPCDFWGMTDSFQIRWHLQSYFLVLKRKVLQSEALTRFFDSVLPYRDKPQLIRSYELGLALFLCENGFRPAAFAPVGCWCQSNQQRRRIRKCRQNPTMFYPNQLLQAGMPFVKVELLRDNPKRVALKPVRRAIGASQYDLSLIQFDREPSKPKLVGYSLRHGWRIQEPEIDAEVPSV